MNGTVMNTRIRMMKFFYMVLASPWLLILGCEGMGRRGCSPELCLDVHDAWTILGQVEVMARCKR
jgi:hypothetical protein